MRVANTHGWRGDGLGDALAAGQARADELPGVALVHRRAGRADGLAAVAAGDVEHSPVLGGGVVDRGGLAGGQVDGVDAAAQPDRVGAVAGGGELAFPGAEVSPGDDLGVVGVAPGPEPVRGPGSRAAVAAMSAVTGSACQGPGNRRR